MTTTPPPEPYRIQLPEQVDYHHVITLLTALLPGVDPTIVSSVHIDYLNVAVWYWDGYAPAVHNLRITHAQGSATEGGHPTTPPTGLRGHDGSDTK